MPILTELVVSIVGCIATALILNAMVRSAPIEARSVRRRSLLGNLMHLLLAVCGGIAIAMLLERNLIQTGIMPKGLGGRLVLLVGGTTLLWLVMLPLRSK
jgi:hypothetical protein